MDITMQQCRTCGTYKPRTTEFFGPRTGTAIRSPGFMTQCKVCRRLHRPDKRTTPEYLARQRAIRAEKPKSIPRALRDAPDGHKRCTECREFKPMTTEFFYSGSAVGGLNSKCVPCQRERSMTPEAVAARRRVYAIRCTDPAFVQANQDRVLAYAAEKLAQDPAAFRAHRRSALKKWEAENPELVKARARLAQSKRRTQKANNGGSHTTGDVLMILQNQNNLCAYCEIELQEYHIDHVHPIVKGGTDNPDNLAISCPLCNQSKGGKMLAQWKIRPTKEESAIFYAQGYVRRKRVRKSKTMRPSLAA